MVELYTFLKRNLSVTNIFGVCLVVLCVSICEVVDGQVLIPNYVKAMDHNATESDVAYLQPTDKCGCLKITQPNNHARYSNTNVYTSKGVEIEELRNLYKYAQGNPHGTGYYYYNGSKWNYSTDQNVCNSAVDPTGGNPTSVLHIRFTSGDYNNRVVELEWDENSGCYFTNDTKYLLYSNWRLEDACNKVIPLRTEFVFNVWGNDGQRYNNNNGNTSENLQPLQHCGWDRTDSYTNNCTSYDGLYFTLYVYKKNGDWYASECCGGCVGDPHHVKSTANVNGDTRQLQVVNPACYSVNETSNLHNGHWHLEDQYNNTLPLIAEFNFTTQNDQPYNNNPVEGQYVYDGLYANCWNYNDQNITDHCILYVYKRDGMWYASEDLAKCQAAADAILSITPSTTQKVCCDDITFLANQSSNSIEWYYGSTKLSNGDGIIVSGNRLTISPSYVYTNGNASVYAKDGEEESNKVVVSKSVVRLRTSSNGNYQLTRYTKDMCPDMCAYKFSFDQVDNLNQWWFEKDGVKMSLTISPDCPSDFSLTGDGNFNYVDRSKFTTGYIYYDNGWVFSIEDPCRCLMLSVDNTVSICDGTMLSLDVACDGITSWTWQRSSDGKNSWSNVQNNGSTLNLSDINSTVYYRVTSGNEKSNIVRVSKNGIEVATNNQSYTSLNVVSGCSACAFAIPLNGSINLIQNGNWYFRKSSDQTKLSVVVDSDASFVTKNSEGNFNGINGGSTESRFYGTLYLYEDGGTWHLTSKNPCSCVKVNVSGNISCESVTYEISGLCGHDNISSYKLERWDGGNWSFMKEKSVNSFPITSNALSGARYIRASYAYGNNSTWVYSDPIEVNYFPFEFKSTYDAGDYWASHTTGAKIEV
ncbi:MAG: hypothetical protein J6X12_08160, partial [Paludibacteraceae bacterium]|nr:hypothetical protein [Paludibacteraceae bacterium]